MFSCNCRERLGNVGQCVSRWGRGNRSGRQPAFPTSPPKSSCSNTNLHQPFIPSCPTAASWGRLPCVSCTSTVILTRVTCLQPARWHYFPKAVPPHGAGAKGPPPHTEASKCSRSPNRFSRSPTAKTVLLPLADKILLIFDIPLPPEPYSMGLVISQF